MRRSERRLLEEKLRYVAMEDVEFDPEREQQMLEQVKADFLQQKISDTDTKRSKRHGIGRRVLLVPAAAVLILVLSFAFTVLTPGSVSHAKGFVRTAAIWLNNVLHLELEFEEPTEQEAYTEGQDAIYSSLEEAAADIAFPLLYFDDPNVTLQSIAVQKTNTTNQIHISYIYGDSIGRIILTTNAETSFTNLTDKSQTIIPWQEGELYCWNDTYANYAFTYHAGQEVFISMPDLPFDQFLILCQTIKSLS